MIREVYTVIKWKYIRRQWMVAGEEYRFKDVDRSFPSRKEANKYLRQIGAVYENGYFTKGDFLYTVKKNSFDRYV